MSGQELAAPMVLDEKVDVKNTLMSRESPVALKYIAAGRIADGVLKYLVREIAERRMSNVYDICRTGDALIEQECAKVFKNVQEKGVAGPTCVDVNNCVWGYAPNEREGAYVLVDGDVAKISFGVHIDGYTVLVSHTVIALPNIMPVDQLGPSIGGIADVICASYVANRAVTGLLGTILYSTTSATPVNGLRIKALVESVANTFHVKIVPGSQVRRVKRFLVGQDTVSEVDVKGYAWGSLSIAEATDDPDEGNLRKRIDVEAVAEVGETWIVDIAMCSYDATTASEEILNRANAAQISRRALKPHKELRPTIFTRDYSLNLNMKSRTARAVLSEIDTAKSVFPFHVSALTTRGAGIGLLPLVDRGLMSATNVMMIAGAGSPLVARERSTVALVPSVKHVGEAVVLAGGDAKLSWVHSEFEVTDEDVKGLLGEKPAGVVRVHIVHGQDVVPTVEAGEMDVEES
ncbi:uncharacterized protein V1518DRAFT_410817 [Limtongia smithiae]|uniref:uncharacterized protein n=1 Tax=Limtongia smithiae TaxID=1125753 RepID=UPI0034CE3753